MDNDRVVRYRSGDGAQFSSKKCPSAPGLETSCELPFGYVWTPMAPCSKENVTVVDCKGEALPPVLCLSCLTYINKFAKLDAEKNVWECPLCGSDENVLEPSLIQQGGPLSSALSTPIVEYRQQLHMGEYEGEFPSRTYILVLDTNLSREEANAVGLAVEAVCTPREGEIVKLGLIVFDKSVAMYQLGLSGMASADLCTTKQANSDEHLQNRRSQILKRPYIVTIKAADDDFSFLWRCISAVYGTTLTGESAADSTPGESPQPVSRLEKLKQRKEARQRQEALDNAQNSASATPRESPWVKAREKAASSHAYRCTGEAIQCAIDLATISQAKAFGRTQILLFTNGCPNLGDGSVVAPDHSFATPKSFSSSSFHRLKPDVIQPERLATAVQVGIWKRKSSSEIFGYLTLL
jgi:hypothetical protein